MNHDISLHQLQKNVAYKKQLEAKLKELREQRRTFDRKVIELRSMCRSEQKDVDKLEGRSLANYFYLVFGGLEEKLTKERQQAAAAKVKLDAAEGQLSSIDLEIQNIQTKLYALQGCEEAYSSALKKKHAELKSSSSPAGINILKIEEKIAFLESQKTELREAYAAGQNAIATADRILAKLDSADGWNTWDILGGDGIITHMVKHSHLDQAQNLVEMLQDQLRRFKTELADVEIQTDLQIKIDGFLRVADYCFDGLFADWAVGNRIGKAKTSVVSLKDQILQALKRLSEIEKHLDKRIKSEHAKIEKMIVES